ncbi:redox-regulated ATPase YchF [Streptomyces caniscabiei]|uniref:redox-regulated ATPase YchF n=1 Tax=Streptomyces caniscabiei TaxID=2746961 RepID=UPI0029B008C9|nr:redox-regulated ATPase YchF [Streptomyces caniscabiei]MDX2776313.1 redox-regulated ATPase YchF [Streptomyces caniscabiei]
MSSLSIGIVGLPNVGKSTLFNALTNNDILAANYPFATIEPNTGIVPVPDDRLKKLADLYSATKVIPATVTFVDIAGLVAGASKGEGLGNKFLANIRQCDAIIHIVRAFENNDIVHVADNVNPKDDIEVINTELILADLQTIDTRLPKVLKEAKAKPALRETAGYLEALKRHLESGTPLSALPSLNLEHIADLHLLTAKPVIYAFNVDEETLTDTSRQDELRKLVAPNKAVFVCAKLEEEIKGLDEADAKELLESYGVKETGLTQMIHAAYDTLGLQSYLTAGPKEVRAWTIKKGATAPQAAGVIHTDFERGFIAAQVVDYDDLVTAGSEVTAKQQGKVRTEGKDYVMQPGDVVEFRFNV